MTTGDTIVIPCFHIASPWADTTRQWRVLDAAQDRARGGRILFAGDFGEEMMGVKSFLQSPLVARIEGIATHVCRVEWMDGNWPHDDRRWLEIMRPHLRGIRICADSAIRIGDTIITHGDQWDRRRPIWDRFQWVTRHIPWAMRWAVRSMPSGLVHRKSAMETAIIGAIHERAARYADRLGVTVVKGHTHRAADIRVGDGRVIDLGTAGQAVGMPLIAAVGPSGGVEIMEVGT